MRWYRALLWLYPAAFRAEYGAELEGLFAERHRRSGPLGRLGLWLGSLGDTLTQAAAVHWDLLRQDLRYTVRTLRRAPGFAVTAIVVTALGIGANTAVFTVTDRALIRPLPFSEPEDLVKIWGRAWAYNEMEMSPADYRDLRLAADAFERLAAYHWQASNLVGVGEPKRVEGVAATGDLFPMLGVEPLIGRTLGREDDAPDAPDTVVLSYGLWQRVFGGDPAAVGLTVRLDDLPLTVIGVMPREFEFPSRDTAFWRSRRFEDGEFEARDDYYLKVVGRLASGVSVAEASSQVTVIGERLAGEFPETNGELSLYAVSLHDDLVQGSRLVLWTLFAASLCVLLVACTNLGSLLWVRALGRRKELALRSALGAGRERTVRQLLTESLLLAGCGGALGMALAVTVTPLLATLIPADLPVSAGVSVDLRVMTFAALLALATGVGFGVVPALRLAGHQQADGMREGARAGIGGRRERGRAALVAVQVAASVVLLVGSGLLLRALWRVQAVDPGFTVENVLTLETALPMSRYAETARRAALYDQVLEQVRALPEVEQAAYISFLPMVMDGGIWPVETTAAPEGAPTHASLRFVTPGFFDTLGIPRLAGRDVAVSDDEGRPMVAVVSQSFAERHWPGRDPVGQSFGFAFRERVVAGVVGEVRHRGLERASEPQVYLPYRQVPDGAIRAYAPKFMVVRSARSPLPLVPAIREIVQELDPELPISSVRLLEDIVVAETTVRRSQLGVLTVFAVLALVLSGLGIHGLLSYAVGQRIGELGVRRALGASGASIAGMVVGRVTRLVAIGLGLGLAGAWAAGRGIEALLAGGGAGDPAAFAVAALVVALTALSGSLLPMVRALRVEPTAALRAE